MKIPRYLRPVGAGPVPALAPSENNKISNHRSQITNSGRSPAQSICYFRSVICDLLFSEKLRRSSDRGHDVNGEGARASTGGGYRVFSFVVGAGPVPALAPLRK